MFTNVVTIIEKTYLNKSKFIILDSSKNKIWELKKHDSIMRKIINFHLRVKLSSTFFLYNDETITHEYYKKGKSVFIKNIASEFIEEVTFMKKSGDYSYNWGKKHFEITSVYQTSVIIKIDNRTIGQISFEHSKNDLFNKETIISINLENEYSEIIPIIILIYVNEFYQNNIGGSQII